MKISLNWLSDYVEFDADADKIAHILMDRGFPCEGIEVLADDTVLDVEVTSNRGDCLGHIGVARELAAALDKPLQLPVIDFPQADKQVSERVSVEIQAPDLCGRYTARAIQDVTIGPAPDWMVRRLEAVGLRSVNNVVDATNYALMETGQPSHAFDLAKIDRGAIIVRRAHKGEQIVSIDGTQCELSEDMLVIADPQRPVAIAGVMGGVDTEVGAGTTTVLLEDAHFAPVTVRSTSRALTLPSEAAFRFERTVDIDNIEWASRRTAHLIVQAAGGQVLSCVVDCFPKTVEPKSVELRLARLNALLGIEVPVEVTFNALQSLGVEPRRVGGRMVCSVPSWRSDIYREVDLIEEVVRSYGYDKIATESSIEIEVAPLDKRQKLTSALTAALNGHGFHEAINVAFVEDRTAALFASEDTSSHLAVSAASRKTANKLRRTLLGSLLGVLRTNVYANNLPCRVYELANTFIPRPDRNSLPEERTKLSMVADGDLRILRGAVEAVIRAVVRDAQIQFEPAQISWARAGARILANGGEIGRAGVFAHEVVSGAEIKNLEPVGAEIDFEQLAALQVETTAVKPVPRFPAIERDLSVVVGEGIRWADIVKVVNQRAPGELEGIDFVEIYRGKGIDAGKKSVTLSLRFRDQDGTLKHETVDGFQAVIVAELGQSLMAELRTA